MLLTSATDNVSPVTQPVPHAQMVLPLNARAAQLDSLSPTVTNVSTFVDPVNTKQLMANRVSTALLTVAIANQELFALLAPTITSYKDHNARPLAMPATTMTKVNAPNALLDALPALLSMLAHNATPPSS